MQSLSRKILGCFAVAVLLSACSDDDTTTGTGGSSGAGASGGSGGGGGSSAGSAGSAGNAGNAGNAGSAGTAGAGGSGGSGGTAGTGGTAGSGDVPDGGVDGGDAGPTGPTLVELCQTYCAERAAFAGAGPDAGSDGGTDAGANGCNAFDEGACNTSCLAGDGFPLPQCPAYSAMIACFNTANAWECTSNGSPLSTQAGCDSALGSCF